MVCLQSSVVVFIMVALSPVDPIPPFDLFSFRDVVPRGRPWLYRSTPELGKTLGIAPRLDNVVILIRPCVLIAIRPLVLTPDTAIGTSTNTATMLNPEADGSREGRGSGSVSTLGPLVWPRAGVRVPWRGMPLSGRRKVSG